MAVVLIFWPGSLLRRVFTGEFEFPTLKYTQSLFLVSFWISKNVNALCLDSKLWICYKSFEINIIKFEIISYFHAMVFCVLNSGSLTRMFRKSRIFCLIRFSQFDSIIFECVPLAIHFLKKDLVSQ